MGNFVGALIQVGFYFLGLFLATVLMTKTFFYVAQGYELKDGRIHVVQD